MKKIFSFCLISGLFSFGVVLPVLALTIENPIKYNTVTEVVDAIITFIMIVSFPLLTGAVLYGGFLMIAAAGDPAKFHKGWQTIVYAIVGFIVVLLAKGIVMAIQNYFQS